jgi:hypothetical protein
MSNVGPIKLIILKAGKLPTTLNIPPSRKERKH